MNNVHKHFM